MAQNNTHTEQKTKNTLSDLNNLLFESIERLNDDDLTGEDLDRELKRADGMAKIAQTIIANGELAFKSMKYMDEMGYDGETKVPRMLEVHNA